MGALPPTHMTCHRNTCLMLVCGRVFRTVWLRRLKRDLWFPSNLRVELRLNLILSNQRLVAHMARGRLAGPVRVQLVPALHSLLYGRLRSLSPLIGSLRHSRPGLHCPWPLCLSHRHALRCLLPHLPTLWCGSDMYLA
jgi:hypothetical protein